MRSLFIESIWLPPAVKGHRPVKRIIPDHTSAESHRTDRPEHRLSLLLPRLSPMTNNSSSPSVTGRNRVPAAVVFVSLSKYGSSSGYRYGIQVHPAHRSCPPETNHPLDKIRLLASQHLVPSIVTMSP
jgi:hypothetical protein